MLKQIARLLPSLIVLLALTACNMPGGQAGTPGPSVNDAAATIVAQTMNAVTSEAPATTPFASPVTAATATSAGKPSLFINIDNAACRSGPGPDFKVIAKFPAGTSVDLAAKDTADGYWIVRDPTTLNLCWVSIQDATPTGDYQSLPETTRPTPSVSVPARPGSLSYNFFCDNTTLTVSLNWIDSADNENGYRVFRKGSQVADLPANSTTYNEQIPYTIGTPENYSVIAYNDAGDSPERSTPTFSCQ